MPATRKKPPSSAPSFTGSERICVFHGKEDFLRAQYLSQLTSEHPPEAYPPPSCPPAYLLSPVREPLTHLKHNSTRSSTLASAIHILVSDAP